MILVLGSLALGSAQEAHVPSWQIARFDVFDKPAAREAMLRLEDETLYGSGGEAIVDEVAVGENIAIPCERQWRTILATILW